MGDGFWFFWGVAVAVLGTVGTALAGAWGTTRIEDRRHSLELERRQRDERRQVYANLLAAGDRFAEAASGLLIDRVEAGRPTPNEARTAFDAATASAQIVAGAELQAAIRDWHSELFNALTEIWQQLQDASRSRDVRALEYAIWARRNLAPRRLGVLNAMRAELGLDPVPPLPSETG